MAIAHYSPLAREDIDAIAAYIADDNPTAARQLQSTVQETVSLLAEFPTLGPVYPHPDHPDLRAKLVTGFKNFVIFYAIRDERVFVVRLLHTARDMPRVLDQ